MTLQTFGQLDKKAFNFRAAAVCMDQGRVLLLREEPHSYFFLPGGKVEFLESSQQALQRELQEELKVDVSVGRLLWMHEHRFDFGDHAVHELCFYYLVNLPEAYTSSESFDFKCEGRNFYFVWQPIEAIDQISLMPAVLKKYIGRLPAHPIHIVGEGLEMHSPCGASA